MNKTPQRLFHVHQQAA